MNFLGHAYLSFDNKDLLVGNLLGDFVKGGVDKTNYSQGIKDGLILHRKIDAFSDQHPASLRARNLFRPQYRLYSGAFVDALYDHFLANDPQFFKSEATLKDYTQSVYNTVRDYNSDLFPEHFNTTMFHMEKEDWLYRYRTVKGMQLSFNGIVHKAKYLEESQIAYEIFVGHYYQLNQWYFEFIDDITKYVKNELSY